MLIGIFNYTDKETGGIFNTSNNQFEYEKMDTLLIASTTCTRTGRALYLSDLRGCDGRVKNPLTPKSDYGYVNDHDKALPITQSEWNRFAKYQRDIGRGAICSPA